MITEKLDPEDTFAEVEHGNALFMASMSTARSDQKVSKFYNNLRNRGKTAYIAFVAIAYELIIILNAKMRAFLNDKNPF